LSYDGSFLIVSTVQTASEEKLKERPLSKETIRNIVAALRAAFTEAVESNIVAANPAAKLGKFYKDRAEVRRFDCLSNGDMRV
jgi:hypothetical protein